MKNVLVYTSCNLDIKYMVHGLRKGHLMLLQKYRRPYQPALFAQADLGVDIFAMGQFSGGQKLQFYLILGVIENSIYCNSNTVMF